MVDRSCPPENSASDKSLLSKIHPITSFVTYLASMSTAHTHEQAAPVVDSVATQPITAAEPIPDTVKPIAAESTTSPEDVTAADSPATAPAAKTAAIEAEAEKPVSRDEAVVESQPINEGVLQYKAPGLVK